MEHPQYTRPADFRGMKVPDVLLEGHHAKIDEWRKRKSLQRTYERRPDLLEDLELDQASVEILEEIKGQSHTEKE